MSKQKQTLLFGAHISIAGGFEKSIERAMSIHTTAMQIFTKSNKQWKARPISPQEADLFKKTLNESSIKSVIAHASYLLNIGSANPELNRKSVDSLITELSRCETLNIPYLVLHPGSAEKENTKKCIQLIIENINSALDAVPGKTSILVENTAGQGNAVGYSYEQLATIIHNIKPAHRIGICIDTCHSFAAGYDFRTPSTYNDMWKKFDDIIGLKHLKVMHINDSKKDLGSRIDRHEHIGKGKLGLEPFRLLFNDERFFDIPKILETPKDNGLEDDIKNIQTILGLLTSSTRKLLAIENNVSD